MLSVEENEFITRIGPGTPMGDFFRRFWLPALLPEEVPEPDCPPVRLRLLGEDLVAFRDTNNQVGILGAYCSHRRAPLFFGRNEEGGIRCVYHGWKFDVLGNCVDMPSEPPESNFKRKIRHPAYPAREWGGVIWVYMGLRDKMPELPQLEWARVPPEHRRLLKTLQQCNWLQAFEGDIDTAHISFLHRGQADGQNLRVTRPEGRGDGAPRLGVKETDYGFCYFGRRTLPSGQYYWRVTQWLLPTYSLIPAYEWPRSGKVWVPVDDHHTFMFSYMYDPYQPLSPEARAYGTKSTRQRFKLPDGTIIDTWVPECNKDNDYLIDRKMQRTLNYTGIRGIQDQDRAMTEGMGYVVDRSQEHLGTSDIAIIAARRRLLRCARDLQRGIEPVAPYNGDLYRVRALDVVDAEADFDRLLTRYGTEIVAVV